MSRYVRNTVVQAKIESVYGSDPGSWAATDALLISEATYGIDYDNISRDLIRGYFGGSDHLQGVGRSTLRLVVEMAGSGTAGTAPAWGKLLRGCAMAQTLTASTMAEYTPVSTAMESLTIRYFLDGLLFTCVGARGTATLRLQGYDKPMIEFDFQALDTVAATATSLPSTDFAAWKKPLPVVPANGAEVRLGASYNAGSGVLSGGTVLASRGMEVMLGNEVSHLKLLTGESIDVTNREVTGRMSQFLAAADEVTWRTDIKANAVTSLGFQLGSAAGSIIGAYGPAVQRTQPANEEYEGRKMLGTSLRFLPSGAAGNDELRIIAR